MDLDLDLTGILPANQNSAASAAATATAVAPEVGSTVSGGPKRATRAAPKVVHPRGKLPLYFDLETIPDEERIHQFGLDPLPEPRPKTAYADCPEVAAARASSLDDLKKLLREVNPEERWLAELEAAEKADKKPRKGAFDAIAELRGEADTIAAATAERQKLLSVTPEFNKIVAVGWALGEAQTEALVCGQLLAVDGTAKASEIDLIDRLWQLIGESAAIIGFNVLHFDLPTLFIRSALLGVRPTRRIDLKPWGGDVIDLMKARFPSQMPKDFGLKNLAKYYGLAVPAGEVDGSQVYDMHKRGEHNQIAAYVRSDVEVSRRLHGIFKGFFCN